MGQLDAPALKKGSGRRKARRAARVAKLQRQHRSRRLVPVLRTWTCSPIARAAASTSLNAVSALRIGRIDEHGNTRGSGHQFAQKFQPLRRQLAGKKIDTGQVAARPARGWRQDQALTGSSPILKTMGMVVVAALAANVAGEPNAAITATCRRTRSSANAGNRSD